MKIVAGILLSLCISIAASAQDFPSKSLTKGTWEFGGYAGGGTGLDHADNTQFMVAGGRVGYILTGEHLSGWFRGNFEWAGDVMPVYIVFPPLSAVYGASIKPVIWQWNFTGAKKIAPYFGAAGGILFTTKDIPPGDTSTVNFTPQGFFGLHIFTREGRAWQVEADIVHHSNASMGNHNPGYNASLFLTVGYTWYKSKIRK
jgi:lipid A 3-O-deacylase